MAQYLIKHCDKFAFTLGGSVKEMCSTISQLQTLLWLFNNRNYAWPWKFTNRKRFL